MIGPIGAENLAALGEICGFEITSYKRLIEALENRRAFFKSMGATATDHAALTPLTCELSDALDEIFQRAEGRSRRSRP